MINFYLADFCTVLGWLWNEEKSATVRKHSWPTTPPLSFGAIDAPENQKSRGLLADALAGMPPAPPSLSDNDVKLAILMLGAIKRFAGMQAMNMSATFKRTERLEKKLDESVRMRGMYATPMSFSDYEAELRALRETIEDDLKEKWFYHYPDEKARLVIDRAAAWPKTIERFPSAKEDVFEAIDCHATGHYTAAVFHLMRVAEHGLRALARERSVKLPKNRPIEWANWETILQGIEKKVGQIEGHRAGPARSRALEFYRGVLGEFAAFKDAYRNDVMHARKAYDEGQSLSVLTHVREFMERLASKIGENPKAIKWGLKK